MVRTRNHLIINERCRCASGRTSRRIPHCPYGLSVLSERESVSPRLLAAIKDNLFRHYLHLFYRLVANFWQSFLCVVTSSSAAADDDTNLQYTVSFWIRHRSPHTDRKFMCHSCCTIRQRLCVRIYVWRWYGWCPLCLSNCHWITLLSCAKSGHFSF